MLQQFAVRHSSVERVRVLVDAQLSRSLRNVNQQVLELGSYCMQVYRTVCNGDLLPHWDVVRSTQETAGEASRCEVYECCWKECHQRGAASAMSRFARYQSTVREIPSAKSMFAVQPSMRAARLGSMRRRG